MKIFNILLFLLCVCFLVGCETEPLEPLKKPFVITYKYPDGARCNGEWCHYKYTDVNGRIVGFCEDELKYNIGDVIK